MLTACFPTVIARLKPMMSLANMDMFRASFDVFSQYVAIL